MPKKEKFTFIDLFAGCGGLSEGFMSTNRFEGVAHVEWEKPMIDTLRNRLMKKWKHSEDEALKRVIHFDIQLTNELINGNWTDESKLVYEKYNHSQIITNGIKGLVEDKTVDLVIGGPPCQAYSIAGRAQDKDSMKFDYRNYLFEGFVKVVNEFKPKLFVFENVPGMLSAKPGGVFVTERIYKAFQDIGYTIMEPNKLKNVIYSADDFGVPQRRKRVILIGVKETSNLKLDDIYASLDDLKKSRPNKTVKDIIGNLPKFKPLKESIRKSGKNISHGLIGNKIIPYHEPRYHNKRDIGIFKEWLEKEMNSKTSKEKIDFYNQRMCKNSNHAKYRNLEWDKPSPTIVAHLYKDGLMFIHPDKNQARSITVKEAALLQSFPNDFEFIGSLASSYKMIGNAVPPLMAEFIAKAILKHLENE